MVKLMPEKKAKNIRFRNLLERVGGYGLPAWLLTEGAFKLYSFVESNPNMSDASRTYLILGAVLTFPVWPQIMTALNNGVARGLKLTNGIGRVSGYHAGSLVDYLKGDKSKRTSPTLKDLFVVDKDFLDPYEKWHELMSYD